MSLEQFKEKIKPFLPTLNRALNWLIAIAFISLLIAIFNVWSINSQKQGIEVIHGQFQPKFAFLEQGNGTEVGQIVASKSGTKYYFPNCTGLKAIKVENRVFFGSEEEAKSAGYELARNCKKP